MFFRNDSNGTTIANAYWWWDGSGRLVDADIVFHEGAYHFYAFSGCVDTGVYLEDVATHEFGHVLGLDHSAVESATMYSHMASWCDTSHESLDPDDVAGIEALYPPAQVPASPSQLTAAPSSSTPSSSITLAWSDNANNGTGFQLDRSQDGVKFAALKSVGANIRSFTDAGLAAGTTYYYRVKAVNGAGVSGFSNVAAAATALATTNAAPSVSISTPYNSSQYPAGSTISFEGAATDADDGTISSRLTWTSNIDGPIGTGPSFTKVLSAGTHAITAAATDSAGLIGTSKVSVTVASSQNSGLKLSARGYKTKGAQQVDLTWSGFASGAIDIYRNKVKVMTTANDGAQTDPVNAKGGATYSYEACETGTSTCAPAVTVTF